jgi:hypothetical protein
VQHWGDSSKQPRVSNAIYRRIYYYLTADERVGDLMRDLLDGDEALTRVNIGRKLQNDAWPKGEIRASFGTDWSSLCGAWFTEWERTGDPRWRDRIVAGMKIHRRSAEAVVRRQRHLRRQDRQVLRGGRPPRRSRT